MDSSARVRVYFSFERIILDGFYKMRLRNDLMSTSEEPWTIMQMTGSSSRDRGKPVGNERRTAGEEGWRVVGGVWYLGSE